MPELFLHIGMPKCGSTYLQSALYANRKWLLERGVLYPQLEPGEVFHHQIFFDLRNNASASLVRHRQAIMEQMEGAEKVVVSTENFNWGPNKTDAASVRDLFEKMFSKVTVVVYFRNIFEYFNSWYAEHVQGFENRSADDPETFLNENRIRRVDYSEICSSWMDAFGQKNLVARPFIRECFRDRNILNDFLMILGLDGCDGLYYPDREQNVSLSFPALALQRRINGLMSVRDRTLFNAVRAGVVQRSLTFDGDAKRLWISPELVARIEALTAGQLENFMQIYPSDFAKKLYTTPAAHRLASLESKKKIEEWVSQIVNAG